MEFLSTEFLKNPVESWILAFTVSLTVQILFSFIKRVGIKKLAVLASRTSVRWDDAVVELLRNTRNFFITLIALYSGIHVLTLPDKVVAVLGKIVFVSLLIQLCLWATSIIRYWVDEEVREKAASDGARAQTMRAIGFLSTIVVYTVIFLWGLDNFGINITTLVAGLGVGGIAVALAVQNILGDLFASLTIVLDKPFVYGDFIVVGDFKGTIEHVGLKTTRIRSLSGEQLIFPNADLLQSRIRNFKRMQQRRILFQIGVDYDTPLETLKKIPEDLKKIIESHKTARFERAHLLNFGASSLDFEVVYWVLDSEHSVYMNLQQSINFAIIESFAARKISFAFPTQMVLSKDKPAS